MRQFFIFLLVLLHMIIIFCWFYKILLHYNKNDLPNNKHKQFKIKQANRITFSQKAEDINCVIKFFYFINLSWSIICF